MAMAHKVSAAPSANMQLPPVVVPQTPAVRVAVLTTIFNHPQVCFFAQQGEGGEDVRTLIRTLITRGNSNMRCCALHVVLVHYSGIYIRDF